MASKKNTKAEQENEAERETGGRAESGRNNAREREGEGARIWRDQGIIIR